MWKVALEIIGIIFGIMASALLLGLIEIGIILLIERIKK